MLIEFKNIYKWVKQGGRRTFLLNDLSLQVEEGEFLSIMGPSGSGKSTLLNVIGMLDNFDEGEYHFLGEPVHRLKEKQRNRLFHDNVGFIFQAYHLLDDLTVYETI